MQKNARQFGDRGKAPKTSSSRRLPQSVVFSPNQTDSLRLGPATKQQVPLDQLSTSRLPLMLGDRRFNEQTGNTLVLCRAQAFTLYCWERGEKE